MTPQEQEAFVDAYAMGVAYVPRAQVADFVRLYAAGEDIDYSGSYTSIMDALCVWHLAVKWQTEQAKP